MPSVRSLAGRAADAGTDPSPPGRGAAGRCLGRIAWPGRHRRSLHTREVAGSKPAAPIRRTPGNTSFFVSLIILSVVWLLVPGRFCIHLHPFDAVHERG